MPDHIHTGLTSIVVAGISAIIVIQILRLLAAKLVVNPATEHAGRVIGSLVTFA